MGGKGARLLAQGIQPEKLKVQMQQVFRLYRIYITTLREKKKLYKLGASARRLKKQTGKQ